MRKELLEHPVKTLAETTAKRIIHALREVMHHFQ